MIEPSNEIAYSRNLRDHRYNGRRVELEKQIIIGSFVRRLDEPVGQWTHNFRVYIRSMYGKVNVVNGHQDQLSDFVGKAVFRFIGSCAEYVEVVEHEPFQFSSYCNGRLKVIITLIFKARYHTCSIARHDITVPSDDQPCSSNKRMQTIVFVNPSRRMKHMLGLMPRPIDLTKDNSDADEEAASLQRELRRAFKSLKKHPKYLVNPQR